MSTHLNVNALLDQRFMEGTLNLASALLVGIPEEHIANFMPVEKLQVGNDDQGLILGVLGVDCASIQM